jgi:hypothetical protein
MQVTAWHVFILIRNSAVAFFLNPYRTNQFSISYGQEKKKKHHKDYIKQGGEMG